MDAAVHTAGAIATGELVEKTAGGWDGRAQGAGGGLNADKVDGEHLAEFYHTVMGLGDGVYNPWDSYDGVDTCRFRFNGRGRTTYKLSGFASGGGDNPTTDHTWIDLFNMTDNAAVAGSEAFLDKNSYGISGAFTLVDGEKEYRVRQKSGVQNNGGIPTNIKLTI